MLVFDQLKRADNRLQVIAVGILLGMFVLVAGLWWVQIISSKRYEANLKNQSFRSVRVPALRGNIVDRNGALLAENRPRYDVNLYLEEIFDQSRFIYTNSVIPQFRAQNPGTNIVGKIRDSLVLEARYRAVSNITFQVTSAFNQPHILEPKRFFAHMANYPYMPFSIAQNLSVSQVAIYSERFNGIRGLELEVRPIRSYPHGSTAAHLLGHVQRDDQPDENDEIAFKYYLPDFAGRTGMERIFDSELRGKAGVKSLLVNNVGYRQREEIVSPTVPGKNVTLTIDLEVQKAAEKALAAAQANVKGAVVVMDVRNGDILALVSLPAFNPDVFPNGVSTAQWKIWNDENYSYIFNRATYGSYPPGSIVKILTGLAALEAGVMNPSEKIYNPGYYADPKLLGSRKIDDTAPAGDYDFERAFKLSSNTYFIHYGLKAGMWKLIEVAKRFHLGERTGILPPSHETAGFYPASPQGLSPGNIANLCIGQELTVTPLQMACMTAAIANGGRVFYPRLVKEVDGATLTYPGGRIRSNLKIAPAHLETIQRAMLADVADANEGTGRAAYIPDFLVGGKTGTAEIKDKNRKDKITWFVSYGPFENPRYAVVVMVESGASGGKTCAPVARKIYEAIQKHESAQPSLASAKLN